MMRTCITLLFLLASLPLCRAEQVEVARAEALARRFFLQGSALRSTNDLGLQLVWCGQEGKLRASTEAPAFYVYNRTDAPGFIIVSGDDAVVPILGYSYDHTFRADSMPPNLSSWMNSYEDLIRSLREKGTEASPSVRSAWERLSAAEPQKLLATAEWSQGVPYNQQCPLIGGQRAATGCVATAAAILLKYYEWPATVEPQEIHYTTSRGLEVSASLGGSYDWSLMPDKEPDGGFTDEQAAEIARLMFHCGAVCEMDYGLYESSASGITSAGRLIETFDLLPSASTRYKSGYSAEEWNAMLRAELDLDRPLFYGQTLNSPIVYQQQENNTLKPVVTPGKALYAKEVKTSPDQADRYKIIGHVENYQYAPEMDMLFPRIYSPAHAAQYRNWVGLKGRTVDVTTQIGRDGSPLSRESKIKPTMLENLQFFIDYQLNYMYWRYFMWNFVGRQNDIQGQGEITHGNWVSGISFIDNRRLGDQSLLPTELTTGNKGHNVFYCLPLLLGIIGLLWQAFTDKRGIEQFWVIFFLFFMTGIAIVIYLNQTPNQPRERDYAFAGSFYAFAIWVGMGVAGLWKTVMYLTKKSKSAKTQGYSEENNEYASNKKSLAVAVVACLVGLAVPLQMVSQTWDDHDRSGRYAARDFGMNYLSSVDENGIIFTNGDNDTFPLWYCQEVEGYRTDVRVVNLSYLSTDWYINQMRRPAYESAPLPMLADGSTYAYNNRQFGYFIYPDTMKVPVSTSLKEYYSDGSSNNEYKLPEIKYPVMYIPVDPQAALNAGIVKPEHAAAIEESISCNMLADKYTVNEGAMSSSKVMSLDIINASITEGWKRPTYFAMTVPSSYYLGLYPYLQCTGMAYQITPIINQGNTPDEIISVNTDKMYENVTTKFRWGGLENDKDGHLYLDETVRRMVTTTRSTIIDLAMALIDEGKYEKARNVLNLMEEKLPAASCPYSIQIGIRLAQAYAIIGEEDKSEEDTNKAIGILDKEIDMYAQYAIFCQSLSLNDYNRLSFNDQYADQHYFMDLLDLYGYIAPDKQVEEKMEKLQNRGVNFSRQLQFRERYK